MFARGIHDLLGAYANAVFHVEDSTIDSDSIKKRGGEMGVLKEAAPFIESQLGGYDGGAALMSASHQIEKKAGLLFFVRNVA